MPPVIRDGMTSREPNFALANANKFEHIQVANARRRLVSPLLVTPAQLLEINP